MKFIHLTDTHLLTPGVKLHGIDALERLHECLGHICSQHSDAEFCVLTGDLADRGERQAYQLLHDALEQFPLKVHLLLGNHDDRENFLRVFPNKKTDENGFIQQVVQHQEKKFIMLDTLDQGKHQGLLCQGRLDWLAQKLEESSQHDVYLFMHHPPFPIGIPALDAISLGNPGQFESVISGYGNIRHLFFGHVHRPVSGSWKGIPMSSLFSFVHQVAFTFQGDQAISYSKEPPAYCVVEIGEGSVVVNTCFYQDKSAWRPERRPSLSKS